MTANAEVQRRRELVRFDSERVGPNDAIRYARAAKKARRLVSDLDGIVLLDIDEHNAEVQLSTGSPWAFVRDGLDWWKVEELEPEVWEVTLQQ